MLTLTRKQGESLYLMLADGVDPKTPIGEVLGEGPIVIQIARLRARDVRVGVVAPEGVLVLREELVEGSPAIIAS